MLMVKQHFSANFLSSNLDSSYIMYINAFQRKVYITNIINCGGSVLGPCFVMQYLVSFLVLQAS